MPLNLLLVLKPEHHLGVLVLLVNCSISIFSVVNMKTFGILDAEINKDTLVCMKAFEGIIEKLEIVRVEEIQNGLDCMNKMQRRESIRQGEPNDETKNEVTHVMTLCVKFLRAICRGEPHEKVLDYTLVELMESFVKLIECIKDFGKLLQLIGIPEVVSIDLAFWAVPVLAAHYQKLLWVVSDICSKNGMTAPVHTITASQNDAILPSLLQWGNNMTHTCMEEICEGATSSSLVCDVKKTSGG
ncbi:predicted protein [Postia placenta Mad-698-R]|nr:predicted protein [Postia placenta Mad-698-R]